MTKVKEKNWIGRWCFPKKHLSLPWNIYVYFRKEVTIDQTVARALVRVTADARYTLFVNGQRVHQGPARFFPQHPRYDVLDLKPFLTEGKNAICAIVHQFGVPTFYSQFRDAAGFLLDGSIETKSASIPLHTPTDWVCKFAKGWRKDVVRMSIQTGFQEHFDADQDEPGWMLPDFQATEENGWLKPMWEQPVGALPWLHLEERAVPLLTQKIKSFAGLGAMFSGESARGYKVTPDVYHFTQGEEFKRARKLFENPEAMLQDNDATTTLPPPTDGEFACVVLEAGTYASGHFIVDIADARGDEIIDILYADDVDKNGFVEIIGDAERSHNCEQSFGNRYRCRPGAQRWETFNFIGFRYVAIIFRNVEHPMKIRFLGYRQVHAKVDFAGSFQCSDEKLNKIWELARTTQLNCTFDSFVDCPQREQAQWWGDARVQAKTTAYAFGDASIFAAGIRQMAQGQLPGGELQSHPPADFRHALPDFMLTWINSLTDHHWQTGQTQLLAEVFPALERVLAFLQTHEVEIGLLDRFDGFWLFLDWQGVYKGNVSAVFNLMYLQALRNAAYVADLVGQSARADEWRARSQKVQSAVEKYFWNDKTKQWHDGFDLEKDEQLEQVSQHANTLAMLLGLKPDAHEKLAKEVLLKSANARKTNVVTASPFFYSYVLEALFNAGLKTEAIDVIARKWGQFVDAGAVSFWEHWGNTESRCHAWSTSPLYLLSQQVLGVKSTAPGWTKVRIAPVAHTLEFAKGSVPTPHGVIRVEWERAGEDQLAVKVDIPAGIEAEFVSINGEVRELEAGVSEFQG